MFDKFDRSQIFNFTIDGLILAYLTIKEMCPFGKISVIDTHILRIFNIKDLVFNLHLRVCTHEFILKSKKELSGESINSLITVTKCEITTKTNVELI